METLYSLGTLLLVALALFPALAALGWSEKPGRLLPREMTRRPGSGAARRTGSPSTPPAGRGSTE